MTSKALAFTFGLLILCFVALAQDRGKRQLVVPLAEGGFVAFKSEAAWVDRAKTPSSFREGQTVFDSQALVDENHVIHRVLVDAGGKFIFGYDVYIEPDPVSRKFKIAVNPLDGRFESRLLGRSAEGQSPASPRISTLPQSADPQVLDDGDSFALDLLINQDTGVKIVDIVKVSFDRSKLWDTNPRTLPRDFTLDAVELAVKEYRLLINGNVMSVGKPASNCGGALIWFYVPDHGRFIFSLVPREGYSFQKVGLIEDNRIEFTVKGDHYEWISSAPVLPGGGTWNLWVLHDPKYTPLLDGAAQDPKKKKNKLDQIDAAVRAVQNRAGKIRDQKQTTFHPESARQDEKSDKRAHVMVGGADRIENLWPKQ